MSMKALKILFVITSLGPGGAEAVVAELARELVKSGHTPFVVSLSRPPANDMIGRRLAECGVDVRYLNGSKTDLFLLFKLRRVIKSVSPDVVHSHLIHPNLLCRLAISGTGIPLVNTIHIAERRRGKWWYFLLDRLTYFLADAVTAVSCAAAAYHAERCGMDVKDIRVIYNAVEAVPEAEKTLLDDLRTQWRLEGADKVIGSIGRLDRQKGYDLLLSRLGVLSRLIPPGRKWVFLIIGDGAEMENLRAQAASLRFENISFRFPGFRTDAKVVMALFDVFVMPSRYEGYGLALAEAMTLGLPVVCSSADSLPELCRLYSGDSFIVDMDSDTEGDDLAMKLLAASECSHSAPCVVCTNSEMTLEYLKLYEELLSGK